MCQGKSDHNIWRFSAVRLCDGPWKIREKEGGEFASTIEILLNGVSLRQIRATTPNPDKPEQKNYHETTKG